MEEEEEEEEEEVSTKKDQKIHNRVDFSDLWKEERERSRKMTSPHAFSKIKFCMHFLGRGRGVCKQDQLFPSSLPSFLSPPFPVLFSDTASLLHFWHE